MQITSSLGSVGHCYSSSSAIQTRPIHERHQPIHFELSSGRECIAYPINYDELYNLKGRLLTLVDATFTDPDQRKAHKTLVWRTLRDWMDDIEHAGENPLPTQHTDATPPTPDA